SLKRAAALLGARARRDVPLGPLTTYRVGGAAHLFVAAGSVEDLLATAAVVSETGMGEVRRRVLAQSGVDLHAETRLVGFDHPRSRPRSRHEVKG
ncbi:MAG: hypothetical protein PV358_15600, partial [Acidimicrobiales bacterium]|nr:hypothetical protein [Acidimicrobiales bacterium]